MLHSLCGLLHRLCGPVHRLCCTGYVAQAMGSENGIKSQSQPNLTEVGVELGNISMRFKCDIIYSYETRGIRVATEIFYFG